MAADIPIIDAHIHLYPESEVDTLAWCTPDHPLHGQHSLEEYKAASAGSTPKGFIFLETDRKNDLAAGEKDGSGWQHPLEEVAWLKRFATGQPKPGEGHTADDASLCAAYIPWAPLPSGAAAMERYINLVKQEAGESWPKVKGFRYLLQDKPSGTMLTDKFVESLRLLGRKGLVFDLGVDQHNRGRAQLEEVVEMIDRAHDGVPEDQRVTFIISECRRLIYLPTYLPTRPSTCLSTYLSAYLPIFLPSHLPTYLPIDISFYICIYLYIYPSPYLPMYLLIYLPFYLLTSLSIYLLIYLPAYLPAHLPIHLPNLYWKFASYAY